MQIKSYQGRVYKEHEKECISMQWTEQGAAAFGRVAPVVSLKFEYASYHIRYILSLKLGLVQMGFNTLGH